VAGKKKNGEDKSRPTVRLVGQDGNVFNIIGLTLRAIRKHSGDAAAKEFSTKAFALHDYNEVMRLIMETCDVE
jgi:hypothetical protein